MARVNNAQLNIRSAYARERVHDIVRQTGMTAAEVVEDALRSYVPSATLEPVGALVRCGPLLVMPAKGRRVSHKEAERALAAVRTRKL